MIAPEAYDSQKPIPASEIIFTPSISHIEKTEVRIIIATPKKNVKNGMNILGWTTYSADNVMTIKDITKIIKGRYFWNPSKGLSIRSKPVRPDAHTLITANIPISAPTIETPAVYPGKFMIPIPDDSI